MQISLFTVARDAAEDIVVGGFGEAVDTNVASDDAFGLASCTKERRRRKQMIHTTVQSGGAGSAEVSTNSARLARAEPLKKQQKSGTVGRRQSTGAATKKTKRARAELESCCC